MGSIWGPPNGGRSVITVYVNPDRYTWDVLTESDTFTVQFFPPEYRQALGYLGSHSGRDEDKVSAAGLTPKELAGGITFEEAELTFVCRKLYQGQFQREGLADEIRHGIYENWDPHWMFVGEILEVEDKRYEERLFRVMRRSLFHIMDFFVKKRTICCSFIAVYPVK